MTVSVRFISRLSGRVVSPRGDWPDCRDGGDVTDLRARLGRRTASAGGGPSAEPDVPAAVTGAVARHDI